MHFEVSKICCWSLGATLCSKLLLTDFLSNGILLRGCGGIGGAAGLRVLVKYVTGSFFETLKANGSFYNLVHQKCNLFSSSAVFFFIVRMDNFLFLWKISFPPVQFQTTSSIIEAKYSPSFVATEDVVWLHCLVSCIGHPLIWFITFSLNPWNELAGGHCVWQNAPMPCVPIQWTLVGAGGSTILTFSTFPR